MENENSFMNQQLYDPSYQNSMSFLSRPESAPTPSIPMDESFEKPFGNRDNVFLLPDASSSAYFEDDNPKFSSPSNASTSGRPFPLQCFTNDSSQILNNQADTDDGEVLPDLPSKEAPTLDASSTFTGMENNVHGSATISNDSYDKLVDALNHKDAEATEEESNMQSDMPDLSSDYYENGNSRAVDTDSNALDAREDDDDFEEANETSRQSVECSRSEKDDAVDDDGHDISNDVDECDPLECDNDDNAAGDTESRELDVDEEVALTLESCLDIVELVDDACSSVRDDDDDSFPSVVLPRVAQKKKRRKLNWSSTKRHAYNKRLKIQDKLLYTALVKEPHLRKEAGNQPELENSEYSMMQSTSDINASTANYNLVGVSEYSMLGTSQPSERLVTNNNMRLVIKQEQQLSPNTSIDNMSGFQNENEESEECERDSAFAIKELVAALNNILVGNTLVQKYSDNDYDRFEVVNHENGTLITITGNCRSDDGLQSARRALNGMRYLQTGPFGRNPSELRQCFVKLNRIGNEDENSEEAASQFSTPAIEMEEGSGVSSLNQLSEGISDNTPNSMRKRQCTRCHYIFTEKHFESHVCRYCATCQKVFANVSGFRKHQRYYCPAIRQEKPSSSQADNNELPNSPERASKALEDGSPAAVGRNLVSCEKCGHAFAKASIGRHRCTFCLICHSTSGRCKHLKPPETPSVQPNKGTRGSNSSPSKLTPAEKRKLSLNATKMETASRRSSRAASMVEEEDDDGGTLENNGSDVDYNDPDVKYKVPIATSNDWNVSNTRRRSSYGVYCPHCERRFPNRLFMRRHQVRDKCNAPCTTTGADMYSSSEEKSPVRKKKETAPRAKIKAESSSAESSRRQVKDSNYEARFPRGASSAAKRRRFYMDSDSDPGGGGSDNNSKTINETTSSKWTKQERRLPPPPLNDEDQQEKFSCNYCYMIFSSFVQYKSHIQMHIDENSHECPYCLERFPNKFALKEHVQIHIQGSRIVCRECGERFPSQKMYFKHMLQKH